MKLAALNIEHQRHQSTFRIVCMSIENWHLIELNITSWNSGSLTFLVKQNSLIIPTNDYLPSMLYPNGIDPHNSTAYVSVYLVVHLFGP